MGVRIDMYAVDIPFFESFLDRSVADALWLYYDDIGSNEQRVLRFYIGDESDYMAMYYVKPGEGVFLWCNKEKKPIERSTSEHAFLTMKLRDYFTGENGIYLIKYSPSLNNLLDCFSLCPSIKFIVPITTGYKYWWVEDFLEYAESAYCIQAKDHAEAVTLFRKILRVYGHPWGSRKAQDAYKLNDFSFPIMPVDDIDLWMGVWTDSDVAFVINLIELLMEQDPNFEHPSGLLTDSRDPDSWILVHNRLQEILQIKKLNFKELRVVSFIG